MGDFFYEVWFCWLLCLRESAALIRPLWMLKTAYSLARSVDRDLSMSQWSRTRSNCRQYGPIICWGNINNEFFVSLSQRTVDDD